MNQGNNIDHGGHYDEVTYSQSDYATDAPQLSSDYDSNNFRAAAMFAIDGLFQSTDPLTHAHDPDPKPWFRLAVPRPAGDRNLLINTINF